MQPVLNIYKILVCILGRPLVDNVTFPSFSLYFYVSLQEIGEISNDIAGKSVVRIFIGARHIDGDMVSDFLVGCVKVR